MNAQGRAAQAQTSCRGSSWNPTTPMLLRKVAVGAQQRQQAKSRALRLQLQLLTLLKGLSSQPLRSLPSQCNGPVGLGPQGPGQVMAMGQASYQLMLQQWIQPAPCSLVLPLHNPRLQQQQQGLQYHRRQGQQAQQAL